MRAHRAGQRRRPQSRGDLLGVAARVEPGDAAHGEAPEGASELERRAAEEEGWWEGLIGPGAAIDTDQYFVVCPNIIGGCYGSTGPSSPPA